MPGTVQQAKDLFLQTLHLTHVSICKMSSVDNESVLEDLRNVGIGTCKIDIIDTDTNLPEFTATGFHFGSGWVMTVAHNFEGDQHNGTFHDLLTRAKFTFINKKGEKIIFEQGHSRMAFIHHREEGDDIDDQNMDIAMVKLGVQYEYGRKEDDIGDWEKAERLKLETLELPCLARIPQDDIQPQIDDTVYTINARGVNDGTKYLQQNVVDVTAGEVPALTLTPARPPGASGSPILNVECQLVGLLYGGTDEYDMALRWTDGIEKYIQEGVDIIVNIGTYMAYKNFSESVRPSSEEFSEHADSKANDARENILIRAQASKLTVYLMNTEVFNATVE